MKTVHAKSPCCKAKVHHIGGKRRRCSICKKTWIVRQKKRGRKAIRVHASINKMAFASSESLRHKAERLNKGREIIRRRHAKNLDILLRKLSLPKAPSGKLIAVIDGLSIGFKKKEYTLYLILLRSVKSKHAIVMEPFFFTGHESIVGWNYAFKQLPLSVHNRICAVVSDGITGVEQYAERNNWIAQRCHFHLIAMLQSLRGQNWSTIKNKKFREKIYQTIRQIISTPDEYEAIRLLNDIREMASNQKCPKWFGRRVRGFIRKWYLFRSYRKYPELNLPITTNSAETTCRLIAETISRTRGFRNPEIFKKWAIVQVRTMKPIKCNGHNFTQN